MMAMALIEVCLNNDIEIHAIVRPDSNRLDRIIYHKNIYYHYSLLEDIGTLNDLPCDCDVFFHFAWMGTDLEHRDDPEIQYLNIKYSLDTVRLAKKCGCKKYIGAGSQAEFGQSNNVINDNTLFNPITSYGAAKHASSVLCKKLCNSLDLTFIWARICSVYGPHDSSQTMIMYAIDCFKKGIEARFSEGKQFWNFLYEKDAGEILFRLGSKEIASGEYIVAGEESRPLKEYINLIINNFPGHKKVKFGSEDICEGNKSVSNKTEILRTVANEVEKIKVYSLLPDASSTFKKIDYYPRISFEDGIRLTIFSKC